MSIPVPSACKADALPFELQPRIIVLGVGFEPTRIAAIDLKSTSLDHSDILAYIHILKKVLLFKYVYEKDDN